MNKKIFLIPILTAISLTGCNNKPKVPVTEIILNQTSITLCEEETFTLTATVLPEDASNKNYTFSSLDDDIATVTNKGLVTAVREGKTTIKVTSTENVAIYSNCEVNVTPKEETIDDKDITLTLKQMDAYYYASDNIIKVDTYFRNDGLSKIPYISLTNYYQLLTKHEMNVEKVSEDEFIFTSANNVKATVNTKIDNLQCDDYSNFISTTIYRQEGVPNVYFDGAPFVRVRDVEHEGEAKHMNIDFKKYHINLIAKDDDVYLPLSTASNIFMGPTMITCFYNQNYIFFIDPNDPHFDTSLVLRSGNYQNGLISYFLEEERTSMEAKFSYGEFCFLIDTYYGRPGREALHQKLEETRSLDQALLEYGAVTKTARKFLMSTSRAEYLAGLTMVAAFLSDAGHSVADYGVRYLTTYNSTISSRVSKILNDIRFDASLYEAPRNSSSAYVNKLGQESRKRTTADNNYTLTGDTLMYRFDAFDFDIYDWNNFYLDPINNKMPEDALGNFKRMLDKYEDNLTIKNVVIDITTNGGGYADIVEAFLGLMNAPTYQYTIDTVEDRYLKVNYDIDKNFDGKFDEADNNVIYHYNYAILTSAYSFSCGNCLPAQAKENGIMTLGDRSGGGSCAIIDSISAEGLYVRLSCQDHMIALDKSSIDTGVDATYQLVEYLGQDQYDFTNLYNVTLMSEVMNDFYK